MIERHGSNTTFEGLSDACNKRLWIVILLNATMFVAMMSALAVWHTSSGWPDVIVTAVMAGLFL